MRLPGVRSSVVVENTIQQARCILKSVNVIQLAQMTTNKPINGFGNRIGIGYIDILPHDR